MGKEGLKDKIFNPSFNGRNTTKCQYFCDDINSDNKVNTYGYEKPNNSNNNKQRMWSVKKEAIPVIIGATISKSFRKYVSNIPGKHEVTELEKTATLGTAHILRKVLV